MAQLTEKSVKPDFTYEDFKHDNGRLNFGALNDAEDKWLEELQKALRQKRKGDAIGTIMRWGVADGNAQYIVVKQKPLMLSHIEVGDAYAVPYMMIRGCRLSDIREWGELPKGADVR